MARVNYGRQWQSDRMTDSFQRLGARIALARKAHGETLEERAAKLGASSAALRSLESGAPGTSLGMLSACSAILAWRAASTKMPLSMNVACLLLTLAFNDTR